MQVKGDGREPESRLRRWVRRYTFPVLTGFLFLGTALYRYKINPYEPPVPVMAGPTATAAPQPTATIQPAEDLLASARVVNVDAWPDIEPLTIEVPAAIASNLFTPGEAVPYIKNDLAWNKPTYGSSYEGTSLPRRATNGPDTGKGRDEWAVLGFEGQWLIVDLGEGTTFRSLVSTLSINGTEAETYYIASDDLASWRVLYDEKQILTPDTRNQIGAPRQIILPEPVTARYVGVYAVDWGGTPGLRLFAVLP